MMNEYETILAYANGTKALRESLYESTEHKTHVTRKEFDEIDYMLYQIEDKFNRIYKMCTEE